MDLLGVYDESTCCILMVDTQFGQRDGRRSTSRGGCGGELILLETCIIHGSVSSGSGNDRHPTHLYIGFYTGAHHGEINVSLISRKMTTVSKSSLQPAKDSIQREITNTDVVLRVFCVPTCS